MFFFSNHLSYRKDDRPEFSNPVGSNNSGADRTGDEGDASVVSSSLAATTEPLSRDRSHCSAHDGVAQEFEDRRLIC